VPDLDSDLTEAALAQAATEGVASASVDGQSVTATPIPDLIALDRHVAEKRAASSGSAWGGVKMVRGNTPPLGGC
jgi:hypothetical protein